MKLRWRTENKQKFNYSILTPMDVEYDSISTFNQKIYHVGWKQIERDTWYRTSTQKSDPSTIREARYQKYTSQYLETDPSLRDNGYTFRRDGKRIVTILRYDLVISFWHNVIIIIINGRQKVSRHRVAYIRILYGRRRPSRCRCP